MLVSDDKNKDLEDHGYDLNELARESWQLELLVSGILLLLLFSSDESSEIVLRWVQVQFQGSFSSVLALILYGFLIAIAISKVFFIFHVVVRGLWIGAIGLRSVSHEINMEGQHMNVWFNRFLNKYHNGFDAYILRLEKLASVVFSFNFLLIFYMFTALLMMGWLILTVILASQFHGAFAVVSIILGLGLLLTFIDFVTLQGLKKGKLGYIFYPFYRIVNFLSLSFLFRPLHYNFTDHPYTRRILRWLVAAVFILFIINGVTYNLNPWLNTVPYFTAASYNSEHYNSDLSETFVVQPFLSSYENTNLLRISTPLRNTHKFQQYLFSVCPEFEDESTLKWYNIDTENGNFSISTMTDYISEKESKKILDCYAQTEEFLIDDQVVSQAYRHFLFNELSNEVCGFYTIIPIDSLSVGPHKIEIRNYYSSQDTVLYDQRTIPFYKLD